jgi:glutathione S-transferase
MIIKLHRCSGTAIKGPHPCWIAQSALDEAGIEYELIKHSALRPLRSDVKAMTGQKKMPLIEFEDGTFLRDSKVIAERARAGTLHGPGETAPFAD